MENLAKRWKIAVGTMVGRAITSGIDGGAWGQRAGTLSAHVTTVDDNFLGVGQTEADTSVCGVGVSESHQNKCGSIGMVVTGMSHFKKFLIRTQWVNRVKHDEQMNLKKL